MHIHFAGSSSSSPFVCATPNIVSERMHLPSVDNGAKEEEDSACMPHRGAAFEILRLQNRL